MNTANHTDKDVITKSMVLEHFKGYNSANKVRFVAYLIIMSYGKEDFRL